MRFRIILSLALILLLLTACGNRAEPPATTAPVTTEPSVPAPVLTPTAGTPLAVLVLPNNLDPDTSNVYQKTVYDLTQQAGYRFQVLNSLTTADLDPALKIVIAVSADPGIAQLAAAAPQAQFLAINIPDITPGGNVSVLANSTQTDMAAFLAGYTAALTTEDYRIGMMIPKDNAQAITALNAFAKGMAYYCGTCKPVLFYNWTYPQYIEIPSTEDVNNYDAYADILMSQYKVGNIFLYPDIYTQDLATYIGTTGTNMIGTISPEQHTGRLDDDDPAGCGQGHPECLAAADRRPGGPYHPIPTRPGGYRSQPAQRGKTAAGGGNPPEAAGRPDHHSVKPSLNQNSRCAGREFWQR